MASKDMNRRCSSCGVKERFIPGMPCHLCGRFICIKCGTERYTMGKNGRALARGEFYCGPECVIDALSVSLNEGINCGPEDDKLWLRYPTEKTVGEFVYATPTLVIRCKRFYLKELVNRVQGKKPHVETGKVRGTVPSSTRRGKKKLDPKARKAEARKARIRKRLEMKKRALGRGGEDALPSEDSPDERDDPKPEHDGSDDGEFVPLQERSHDEGEWERLLDDVIKMKPGRDVRFPGLDHPNHWEPGKEPEEVPRDIPMDWEGQGGKDTRWDPPEHGENTLMDPGLSDKNLWEPGVDPDDIPDRLPLDWEGPAQNRWDVNGLLDGSNGRVDELLAQAGIGTDGKTDEKVTGKSGKLAGKKKQSPALSSEDMEDMVEQGKDLYAREEYAEAAMVLDLVLQSDPTHSVARFLLRKCQSAMDHMFESAGKDDAGDDEDSAGKKGGSVSGSGPVADENPPHDHVPDELLDIPLGNQKEIGVAVDSAKELYASGEYQNSLAVLDRVLEVDGSNPVARFFQRKCKKALG